MKRTDYELLAPAGDFECFKEALYNGANAIYLATDRFGARAYAKNFTLEELQNAIQLAHPLGVKIYVTVNTILKPGELEECKKYLHTLYEMGVDGIIAADYGLIQYAIRTFPRMETHISTQVGVKNSNDVLFFEKNHAKRVVLARETSIDEIRAIREQSNLPLEVFVHGALCVSYSGGCLMSSEIGLRSGNRGRCAQCCRKLYSIYKDGEKIRDKGYYLSLKDLNTISYLPELMDLNVNSFKIEGRMKDEFYVGSLVKEYRKAIDSYPKKSSAKLENIFHRSYTKGFLFHEDNGAIGFPEKANNLGELLGTTGKRKNGYTEIILKRKCSVGDRIRIESDEEIYFTLQSIFTENFKNVPSVSTGSCYLDIFKEVKPGTKVYLMNESQKVLHTDYSLYKKPLDFYISGGIDSVLTLTISDGIHYATATSSIVMQKAKNAGLDDNAFIKQLGKLNDTSYYMSDFHNSITDSVFLPVGEINEVRRKAIKEFIQITSTNREKIQNVIESYEIFGSSEKQKLELAVSVRTKEQEEIAKELGIKHIYTIDNTSLFINPDYKTCKDPEILIGSYGALDVYKGKNTIVTDEMFNCINHDAAYELMKSGATRVTLSTECSLQDIEEIYRSFQKKYHFVPDFEYIAYGHERLMTTKYCPIKKTGACGECKKHLYELRDDYGSFYLIHDKCTTHILNGKRLNLVDSLYDISKYIHMVRLSFTIESPEETKKIIKQYQNKIQNLEEKTNYFNASTDTRGHYKRPIL